MESYVALLRGINVGGKNIIPMAVLAQCFTAAGYRDVRTYSQSGNVSFRHDPAPGNGVAALEAELEALLEATLQKSVMVVVRTHAQLREIVAAAPTTHGTPEHRSDVIFLKYPHRTEEVFSQFPPLRAGVDEAKIGDGVIYFSRLVAQASKSRLNRVVGMAIYQEMTIRNWRTTTRLLKLLEE